MFALVLAIAVVTPQLQLVNDLEGVWFDANGSAAFAGNGRFDWKVEDRYFTAMTGSVPDGSLLGSFICGRDLFVNLSPLLTSQTAPDWLSESVTQYYNAVERRQQRVEVPHLGPDPRTFARPAGEVRISLIARNARGLPAVVNVETTTAGSHTPIVARYTRGVSMDNLSLAGKYADKDVTLDVSGDEGRVGTLSGSLTYLGKKYSLSGRRIMGRGGILLYDDSRMGVRGAGYVAWMPSSDRASSIINRNSTSTDQVELFFRVGDGSTATGIHKTLRLAR